MRAIGTLSNSVLEELLMRVTALEDIPAQAAIQLAEQCQTICKALPLLFNFSKVCYCLNFCLFCGYYLKKLELTVYISATGN